jgi:hypothetical protein
MIVPVTQDKATDLGPVWSPDRGFLLFSSDRDGINNLYAYSLDDERFFKITNVTTGAFAPDLSPDGKRIAYAGYSMAGYDLRVMDFDPPSWREAEFIEEELPEWPGWPKTDYPIHPYNPLPSLRPKLWLPIIAPRGQASSPSAWIISFIMITCSSRATTGRTESLFTSLTILQATSGRYSL